MTLASMYDLIDESDNALGVLAGVVYMHKVDMEYGTIDLDSPTDTYTYFRQMYQAFSQLPEEELEPLFKHFTRLLESTDENDAEAQAQLHQITRRTAEEIRKALRQLSHESIILSANYILAMMLESFQLMIELIQDDEDDDSGVKYPFQLIKGQPRKDSGSSPKDYEVLG